MVYQISYDLKSATADYTAVYERLANFGETMQVLKSTWLISTQMNAEQMTDSLHEVVQKGDRFIISEIVGNRYNGWHAPTTWAWIRDRLNRPRCTPATS